MARRFTYYANLAPSYDADAQAFFTAASITDSGQKTAINTLVLGLKSASIWSKIPCIYPFIGGNSTSHSFNLKDPTKYQLTFFGGWTHSSTGAKPNGTNAYATTNFKPNTDYTNPTSNQGHGVYTNTNFISASYSLGVAESAANAYMLMNYSGSLMVNGDISGNANYVTTDSRGHSLIQKFSTSSVKTYKNGIERGSSSLSPNNKSTNLQFYLASVNQNNVPIVYGPQNLCTIHMHNDLTVTDIGNLYTLIYDYNNTLSRA